MRSSFSPFSHLSSKFLGSTIEALNLLSRLFVPQTLSQEHSGTQHCKFSACVQTCACPRASSHSLQMSMMCSYLMSWMLISQWFLCSVTRGRLLHQIMLPWDTEERGWKGTSHQTTELFVPAAFGPWQKSTALSCGTICKERKCEFSHTLSSC